MNEPKTALDVFSLGRERDQYVPHSLILTAMSAEEKVVSSILHRFTGKSDDRRLAERNVIAFIFLHAGASPDFGKPPPGVYLFPRRKQRARVLQHTKIGILAWRGVTSGKIERIRLFVTTGNWTSMSVAGSLELTWFTDCTSDGLEGIQQLESAANFIQGIPGGPKGRPCLEDYYHVHTEVLTKCHRRYGELLDTIQEWAKRFRRISKVDRGSESQFLPRFIHNLDTPLIDQVNESFGKRRPSDKRSRQNRLVCGSGFVEQGSDSENQPGPQVLQRLQQLDCLAEDAEKRFVINPEEAGTLAAFGGEKARSASWAYFAPRDPVSQAGAGGRFLHAKYVLVGTQSGRWWTDTLLYLGSGNLSRRGLLKTPAAGNDDTNLECGVVLAAPEVKQESDINERLFLGDECTDSTMLRKGDGSIPNFATQDADPCPIAAISFSSENRKLLLTWVDESTAAGELVLVLSPDVRIRIPVSATEVPFDGKLGQLARIEIHGKKVSGWWVPVIDASTGECVVEPVDFKRPYSAVLDELIGFPTSTDSSEDDPEDSGEEGGDDAPTAESPNRASNPIAYPLHEAMALLEAIARQNQAVKFGLFEDWLRHLEFVMTERLREEDAEAFRALNFNFLNHLREDSFRPSPDIMPRGSDREKLYEQLIERLEKAWRLIP